MHLKISSLEEYEKIKKELVLNSSSFWSKIADNFLWFKKWNRVMDCDLSQGKISWFLEGKTNISSNCLDRHLERNGDKVAIVWEANDPQEKNQKITYKELHEQVCQLANLLIARGVKKGDRVCIYMPMIPQGVIAMLACARIGAVHCVVFAGFSAKALAGRIQDCGAKILITADLLFRGDKKIELFKIAEEALQSCDSVESTIVYRRDENFVAPSKTLIWQDEIQKFPKENKAEIMDSEDPLFVLYTSG